MRVAERQAHSRTTWALGVVVPMALVLLPMGPVLAQEGGEALAGAMDEAYASLREAVGGEELEAARQAAESVVQSATELGWDNLSAEQLYMMGLAHYYLMGMAFGDALETGELSEQRAQFAQEMRDLVFPPESAVPVISHGERVNIEDHVVPGKITVFDFYSDYCGPSRALAPGLEALATQREDIAPVKVDINRPGVRGIDWGSPVAQQYQLQGVPYFVIYDANGRVRAEGRQAYGMVLDWLAAIGQ